jgi:curved DNA-binding protein CbpA
MALKTYYDDLQVARGAAPEVIAAAYRSLSRKYHPDHNLGDTNSEQRMKTLNAAYAVLSDPLKRKEHDDWIASEEAKYRRASSPHTNARYRPRPSTSAPKADPSLKDIVSRLLREYQVRAHLSQFRALYLAVIVLGGLWLAGVVDDRPEEHDYEAAARWASAQNNASAEEKNPLLEAMRAAHAEGDMEGNEAQPVSEGAGSQEAYQDDGAKYEPQATALAAPNGSSWPKNAGYVQGYERLNTSGRSRVTIDNSQNSSNAFVKLVDISDSRPHAVRSVFVPAYESFTMRSISPGTYDIRYKDLQDGGISRSETFTLSEITEDNAVRYDTMTITLYKVAHGNMETYPISERDFSGI